MNQDVIKTDNVSVRVMEIEKDASNEWHYHTEVTDYFVSLTGVVRVETQNPDETFMLNSGQRAEVKPPQVHRVVNIHTDKSEYLLFQGVGKYDFIKV